MLRADPSVASVRTACDSAGALRLLQDVEVDVAFIEVRLPGMDGIELASVLKRFRTPPALVFVTRHAERAAEALRLGAVAYLSKPPRLERLAESLRAATKLLGGPTVRWAEAHDHHVRLHTADGSYLIRARLGRWPTIGGTPASCASTGRTSCS